MTKLREARIEYHTGGSAGFFMPRRGIAEYEPSRPLSPLARLIRVHLHDLSSRRKKDGSPWEIIVEQIQRSLRLNEAQWVRARRELEAHGYYRAERQRRPNGKWQWIHHAFEDPQ
ncbi:hypothetical protein HDE79_003188 [Rhodanobacter sp. MP1X3]|nr:hypothetical protein [Rhodanobacter sp. MP1X3]